MVQPTLDQYLTHLHLDRSLPVTQPYPDHVHILPSDSLPFFFVTTTQRVPTRSHSFFPSIYLSYCTDLYILLHCSFTYLCISTGCESSLRVNVLANIPDLRATSSTPVSISSDTVQDGELPLSPRPTLTTYNQKSTRSLHNLIDLFIGHRCQTNPPPNSLAYPYNGIRKLLAASEPSPLRSIWTTTCNGQLLLQ